MPLPTIALLQLYLFIFILQYRVCRLADLVRKLPRLAAACRKNIPRGNLSARMPLSQGSSRTSVASPLIKDKLQTSHKAAPPASLSGQPVRPTCPSWATSRHLALNSSVKRLEIVFRNPVLNLSENSGDPAALLSRSLGNEFFFLFLRNQTLHIVLN